MGRPKIVNWYVCLEQTDESLLPLAHWKPANVLLA